MPARVTFTVIQGKLTGEEFVFDERTSCIIGRHPDCNLQLPSDEAHRTVSRHHCLLDINPPDVRVRDFGSLNGTFVNGEKIGQREKGQTPEEAALMVFPEYDLKAGDEIRLGNTVFRVDIFVPALCAECSTEIPEEAQVQAQIAPGLYQCETCRQKAEQARREELLRKRPKVCVKCGRDVSAEIGANRQGEFLCAACQTDPMQIIRRLLELANGGDKDLLAIQGYAILRELGRGGMGAVYLARHDRTGEQVALKVMLPQVAVNEQAKEKFLRETENTRALRHLNVVQLKDLGCSSGTFFFTLEYCDGGSVDRLMRKRGGTLPLVEASEIILQTLNGLEYAHNAEIPYVRRSDGTVGPGRGLVHRDIKPHNIFLSGSGRTRLPKVGDYGLAKAFDAAGLSGYTRTGTAAGTPHFMPRQQVINFKYAKPEVDVWAMAASFYNMLTGAVPRDFPRGKDYWQVVLQTKPVPIRQRDSSIPKKVAEVIDLALIDQPAIHFKTATEFRQALEKVL